MPSLIDVQRQTNSFNACDWRNLHLGWKSLTCPRHWPQNTLTGYKSESAIGAHFKVCLSTSKQLPDDHLERWYSNYPSHHNPNVTLKPQTVTSHLQIDYQRKLCVHVPLWLKALFVCCHHQTCVSFRFAHSTTPTTTTIVNQSMTHQHRGLICLGVGVVMYILFRIGYFLRQYAPFLCRSHPLQHTLTQSCHHITITQPSLRVLTTHLV